jgi:dTDP-4-dehydrorhamnose reductase
MSDRSLSLVIGADGLLGSAIASRLHELGERPLVTSRRGTESAIHLDIAVDGPVWKPPQRASVAYLCAAVTSLQACRLDRTRSYQINVTGTLALARRLADDGTRVVFPSSNRVFDGTRPFVPADSPTSPQTEYGRMKAEAELRLLELGNAIRVVRISKVFGPRVPLFDSWRVSLAKRMPIEAYTDINAAPVSLVHAADAIIKVGTGGKQQVAQLSASCDVSYADMAGRLAACLRADPALILRRTVAETGLMLEHLPRHTTLHVGDGEASIGITAPDPWQTIDEALSP